MEELAKAPQPSPPFYVTKAAKMVEKQNGWARLFEIVQAFQRYHYFLCKPVFAIWQPCCTDVATLLVVHISKCFHSISHPQKHGFSKKNHVSKSIRTKVTHNILKFRVARLYGIWQPCKI